MHEDMKNKPIQIIDRIKDMNKQIKRQEKNVIFKIQKKHLFSYMVNSFKGNDSKTAVGLYVRLN